MKENEVQTLEQWFEEYKKYAEELGIKHIYNIYNYAYIHNIDVSPKSFAFVELIYQSISKP